MSKEFSCCLFERGLCEDEDWLFCEMNEFCARFNSLVDVKRATKEKTETFGISRDVSQLLESRVRACGGKKEINLIRPSIAELDTQ